jgi:hypothetical protein
MTDAQFKEVYGQEAERLGGGLEGILQAAMGDEA